MLDLQYLATLTNAHADALGASVASFSVRDIPFQPWPEPSMMGVVNLSRDSWYRESVVSSVETAVRRGHRLTIEGAKVIDVGAESTLLHAERVDAGAQTGQLVPVVRQLSELGILVSVESYLPEVTAACLHAGAGIINMTAGENTDAFYRMAAEHEAGVIICYVQNGKNVRDVGDFRTTADHTALLYDYFARETDRAAACGVSRMWIDPGLGFYYKNLTDSAARVRYQMDVFLQAFRLRKLGWPTCQALPHAFEYFGEEVRSAEPFFGVLALLGQTDLLRTHEVARLRGVIETMQVIR